MVTIIRVATPRHLIRALMQTKGGTAVTLARASPYDVALVMEASASFSRGVLQGVSQWMGEHDGWMVTLDDREVGSPIPGWFLRWDGHGVISGLGKSCLPRCWRSGQRPVVHVSRRMPASPLPGVYPDDESAMRLAVSHLAERGVRHLVFNPGSSASMKELCDAAVRHAVSLGCQLDIHEPWPKAERSRGRSHESEGDAVARWLTGLPKPLGVVAASDVLAVRIIEACRRGGLAVPDDVAIVGIGDDEVLCGLASPRITSVTHDRARIGCEAARMLDEAMRTGCAAASVIAVPPAGIAVRRSSDLLAVDDHDIRKALRVIQTRGCSELSAADVALEVRVPRRQLDRKFQRTLGRTIHDELQRTRLAEAKRLLAETDDKLVVISVRSGFSHAPQLCNIFKSVVGMSPMQYRKAARSCREAAASRAVRGAGRRS